MSKGNRIGAILILIGICIPLISFVFVEDYDPRLGFWGSVTATRGQGIHIKLWKRQNESNLLEKYELHRQWEKLLQNPEFISLTSEDKTYVAKGFYRRKFKEENKDLPYISEEEFVEAVMPSIYGDIVLPYKYSFALGIILILSGIGIFIWSKPPKNE